MPVKRARSEFAGLLAAVGSASADPYPVVADGLPIDHVDILVATLSQTHSIATP